MNNVAVIGHDGKLGSQLMKYPGTVAVPWMFENDQQVIAKWFDENPDIDTVWHVARTCRKKGARRDHQTFLNEQIGMNNLLSTRARNCRFIYASSKIVYGISGYNCCPTECNHDYNIMTVEQVAEYFLDQQKGVFNCPNWQPTINIDISRLDHQRTIYALTKLGNEQLVQKYCSNFKIIRIWDIAQ